MDRVQKNFIASLIAFLSGIFFVVSGTNGLNAWKHVESLITSTAGSSVVQNPLIHSVFIIIFILSSFGGITVFTGAWFLFKNKILLGKFFIAVGAGSGIIFLITNIYLSLISTEKNFSWLISYSSLAIIFAVVSRMVAKRK